MLHSTRPCTRTEIARMGHVWRDQAIDDMVHASLPGALMGAREGRGLTQEDLSRLTGLHPTAISQFERGRRVPTLQNLIKLSIALRSTIDELLGVEDR